MNFIERFLERMIIRQDALGCIGLLSFVAVVLLLISSVVIAIVPEAAVATMLFAIPLCLLITFTLYWIVE